MNERIKELAISCGWYDNPFGDICVESDFTEKFAELIILECVNACLKATNEDSPVHLVSIAYADNVKKHFGIEYEN